MDAVQARGLRWAARAVMAVAFSLLVACGGGGGGTGGAPEAPDLSSRRYVPLAVGYRWIYADSSLGRAVVQRITETRVASGTTGYVQVSDDPDDEESVLVEDAQGLRQLPGRNASVLTAAVGPLQLLRYPLRVGDIHVVADRQANALLDVDADGRADDFALRADARVIGLETLDTAAGRFADCLHLRTTAVVRVRLAGSGATVSVTTVNDDWFAPGIGRVRSEISTTGDGIVPEQAIQSITGYGLGSVRSESVAPTASATALVPGVVLGQSAVLNIGFSEDMDAASLAAALRVSDSSGRAVDGSAQATARGLTFSVPAGWASGEYLVRLGTGAQDLVGNPLAAEQTWRIAIDATAPALVASTPAEGATEVPLDSSIVVRFSEPVDPASVSASTLRVVYDGGVAAPMDYRVEGATVTVTPRGAALVRAKPYTIAIDGVTDLLGNPLTGVRVGFQSDPGRFGAFTGFAAAPGAPPEAIVSRPMAVGDLDGDGRADVAATTVVASGGVAHAGLLLYRQRPDGTLAPAVPVALNDDSCIPVSMAIGDVDGDGLRDLVVGTGGCGIHVFRQSPAGVLVDVATLDNPASVRLQLADVDGDGRLDIVAFGGPDTVLRIWRNGPGGFVMQPPIVIDPSFGGARHPDLVVGDLNGDGRPDIAVSGDNLPGFAGLALLIQAADGSFGAPQWLFAGGFGSAGSMAIGDIDGDGRADLVVAPAQGLMVFPQGADGQLGSARRISTDAFPSTVTLADLNGDGRLDILTGASASGFTVLLQQAGGTLAAPTVYADSFRGSGLEPGTIMVADLNGDGRPDALVDGHLFLQRPVPVMAQALRPQPGAARVSRWRVPRAPE